MECKTSRICFLDLLRIAACFFVIVNHTTSDIFQSRTPAGITWFVSITYFFISKFAVPVYLMITGYLLLSKPEPWSKMMKRMGRVILVIILSGIGYWIYHGIWKEPGTDWHTILQNISTIYYKTPSNALWYLYNYLGLLLMMPFFQKMTINMSKQDYHIFFLIYGVFVGTLPILSHYFEVVKLNPHFGVPLFSGHITMLFLGQYFRRFRPKKSLAGVVCAGVLFTIMLAFNVVATYQEAQGGAKTYLFLDNRAYLPIMVQSACVFYIASCVSVKEGLERLISYIGSCTFGIYLLSDMAIDYLKPMYLALSGMMHSLFAVVIYQFFVFAACLLITMLLRKIPGVRKLL